MHCKSSIIDQTIKQSFRTARIRIETRINASNFLRTDRRRPVINSMELSSALRNQLDRSGCIKRKFGAHQNERSNSVDCRSFHSIVCCCWRAARIGSARCTSIIQKSPRSRNIPPFNTFSSQAVFVADIRFIRMWPVIDSSMLAWSWAARIQPMLRRMQMLRMRSPMCWKETCTMPVNHVVRSNAFIFTQTFTMNSLRESAMRSNTGRLAIQWKNRHRWARSPSEDMEPQSCSESLMRSSQERHCCTEESSTNRRRRASRTADSFHQQF